MKRRVMLTVDVEAQPTRALTSHVERLIYGRFGGDSEFGIGRMFDIADRHGIRLTCFLDYAEQFLYEDELLAVGRYIQSRNQDLQVHLHPEFIPRAVFDAAGVKYDVDMFKTDRAQADFLINIAVNAHYKVTAKQPVAFRGGGYRYGVEVLGALAENKFFFNSGYNPSRKNQVFNIGSQKQFRWAEGIAELPISCVPNFKNTGRLFDYNFNAEALIKGSVQECVAKHDDFLQQYFDLHGEDAIAVMVMHSWSFLNINAAGQYDVPNQDYVDKFDALLKMLSEKYFVIAAGDMASMDEAILSDSAVTYDPNSEIMDKKNDARHGPASQAPCSVCGAPYDQFKDFNGPKRKCGVCGSLERQRAFGGLIKSKRWKLDLRHSKFLLVSPSVSERRLFSGLDGVKLSTLDVRSEVKPDIISDLCDMSSVPDGSFNVIYACHVLSHVHDLQAALSELSRILARDGVLINYEPFSKDSKTREIDDIREISAHYGLEAYEKYKIGRFRNFGDQDIETIFLPYFEREAFDTVDEVTGLRITWNVWKKKSAGSDILAVETLSYSMQDCPVCHDSLVDFYSGENCKQCGSRARLRSLTPLIDHFLLKDIPTLNNTDRSLLAFALTGAEKKEISRAFRSFKSVSLFGNYATDHEMGVDMRDLSRYAPNSFSGVFGCLLFDYFVEHERALQECFRVTAPGGVLFTHVAPYRIVDGSTPPFLKGTIKSRMGYFEYLPENTELPDVKVGRDWFAEAMRRVGFEPTIVRVEDAIPGIVSEWFVGVKPGRLATKLPDVVTGKTKVSTLKSRTSTVFQSIIPFAENGLANLQFELIESTFTSLVFVDDHYVAARDDGGDIREIVATNGSRNRLYVSRDLGDSWMPEFPDTEWDSKIRAVFSLSNGGRLVRTFSGRMYHFDCRGDLVSSHDTGSWHWLGSQGIGESPSGAVMYAEYAPLQPEDGIQELSVWRYWPAQPAKGWERILTLPAAVRPPEGELRHFHVCSPNPANLEQWVLATGDAGVHCRIWTSADNGSTWNEVSLPDPLFPDLPESSYPQILRFTQFCTLANGDFIWGTDDTSHGGRAALVRLSLASGQPVFHLDGWLGKNSVRNISSFDDKLFLLLSESKHDQSSADCIVYDAVTGRITSLLLPNLSQASHSVTDSLGSSRLVNGVGFYPASGAVVMNPSKRGIFRVSIGEIVP